MKKITILTGAGVSAESGIKTFRDVDGLWEGHDVTEVASPQGFARNPELVLDFYNQRRRQLFDVKPNLAHQKIAALEEHFEVTVVTQNIDDLHERSGSTNVIHLHGELLKARSIMDPRTTYDWHKDILVGDLCPKGFQLRPHIVWFGEDVPMMRLAAESVYKADIIIIIGTSMQVYPAASLIGFAQQHADIYYIDPKPHINYELQRSANLTVIENVASKGMQLLFDKLKTA